MRGGYCATRRFYTAFYRWNSSRKTPACRHTFSTTSTWNSTPIRNITVKDGDRAESSNPEIQTQSSVASQQHRKIQQRLGQWTKRPVLTTSEKPFDTLNEWEEVIRYRSDASLILQIAIPQRALQYLQKRFGDGLQTLKDRYGVRAEVGSSLTNDASETASVTFSGRYSQVLSGRNAVFGYKGQTLSWDRPRSVTERPFDSLQPLEVVIRESDPERSYLKVETMIPAEDWMRWMEGVTPEEEAANFGIRMESNVRHEQGHSGESQGLTRQQVVVAGPSADVKAFLYKAQHDIGKSRARMRREQAQTQQAHYVLIDIPDDPEDIGRMVVGKGSGALGFMNINCRVRNRRVGSNTLRVWAPSQDNLEAAKQFLQARVDVACEKLGISAKQVRIRASGLAARPTKRSSKDEPPPSKRAETLEQTTTAARQTELPAQQTELPAQQSGDVARLGSTTKTTKRALRSMSHPVVLVTSKFSIDAKHSSPDDAIPFSRGVTVSSFNSVTLTPKPIISFNIRVPSRTWDAISSMRRFSAHLLSATPKGATLAHAFTLPYDRPDEPFWRIQRMGAKISFGQQATQHIAAPIVQFDDAVLAVLVAKPIWEKCVQVGDHMIVVAEVFRADNWGEARRMTGLTYARQGYRGVGEEIEVEVPHFESSAPDAHAKTPATDAPASRDAAQASSSSRAETQDLNAPIETEAAPPVGKNASAAEQRDVDYFEAMEKDDDEIEAAGPDAQAPVQEEINLPKEELEYNFGFDSIENESENDRRNNGDEPVLFEENQREDREAEKDRDDDLRGQSKEKPSSDTKST